MEEIHSWHELAANLAKENVNQTDVMTDLRRDFERLLEKRLGGGKMSGEPPALEQLEFYADETIGATSAP